MHHGLSEKKNGFTLIELVIVLVISSIITMVGSQLITRPVTAYANLSLRAQLVDSADSALKKMTFEIHSALPNSIRVGCSGKCIEFLPTIDGGRYRVEAPGNILSFNQNTLDNDGFEVLGRLYDTASIRTSNNADHCRTGDAHCLVIYNTGQTNYDAYQLDNAATITGISGTPSVVTFTFPGSKVAFPASSPSQRFYITGTPISYLCDDSTRTITRYSGYPVAPSHSSVDSHAELTALAGVEQAMVSNNVNSCLFSYSSSSSSRSSLLTIRLTLSEEMPTGSTESITLLRQVHITNSP